MLSYTEPDADGLRIVRDLELIPWEYYESIEVDSDCLTVRPMFEIINDHHVVYTGPNSSCVDCNTPDHILADYWDIRNQLSEGLELGRKAHP